MNTPTPSDVADPAVPTDASSQDQTMRWHAGTLADDDLSALEGDDPDAGFVFLEPKASSQSEDSGSVQPAA